MIKKSSNSLLGEPNQCHSIVVKSKNLRVSGIYRITSETSPYGPRYPVWKKPTEDLIIFNNGRMGWRIGDEQSLKTGQYLFKSKA